MDLVGSLGVNPPSAFSGFLARCQSFVLPSSTSAALLIYIGNLRRCPSFILCRLFLSAAADDDRSIHVLLTAYGLPPGLLPSTVNSYDLNREIGLLQVDLDSPCFAKYDGLVFFNQTVRAGIVGYLNVGKSSLINRLLNRGMCPTAPRPGVTRELNWVRFGKDLELLDSPGLIPMRLRDQAAAIKLAICDDIGERSYDVTDVAAILLKMLARLPVIGPEVLSKRYRVDSDPYFGKIFLDKLSHQLFNGNVG